jgi:hypothetical protein
VRGRCVFGCMFEARAWMGWMGGDGHRWRRGLRQLNPWIIHSLSPLKPPPPPPTKTPTETATASAAASNDNNKDKAENSSSSAGAQAKTTKKKKKTRVEFVPVEWFDAIHHSSDESSLTRKVCGWVGGW